jgi:hypothetical protein
MFFIIASGNIVLADENMKIKHPSDTDKKHVVIFRAGIINRSYYTEPSIAIITAANINSLTIGGGIGVNGSGRRRFYEMIFALKAYLLPGKVSPLVYSEMGYASDNSRGYGKGSGPIINVGTGLKIRYRKAVYCFFELGFKIFMKESSNDNYFGGTVSIGI